MEKLTFKHLISPKLLIKFGVDNAFESLPYSLLALGIAVGGVFVIWLMKLIFTSCCLHPKYRERWVTIRGRLEPIRHKRLQSVIHLVLESFFFVGIVIVLWIAAAVAGFNFWTSSLVGIAIGAVFTYMFGGALQQIGAGYFIYLTDKIEEGYYIEVNGVEGRVTELHPLYAEMESIDKVTKGVIHTQVPMLSLITSIVKRNFHKELTIPRLSLDSRHIKIKKDRMV